MFLIGLRKELETVPKFPCPTHSYDVHPGYEGIRRAIFRALRSDDLFPAPYWREPPRMVGGLRQAVTAKQATGDLPPIMGLRDGTLRGGPRRFDTPCGYRRDRPSAYARGVRDWPSFGRTRPCKMPRRHLRELRTTLPTVEPLHLGKGPWANLPNLCARKPVAMLMGRW
jgi:hypothetical protein